MKSHCRNLGTPTEYLQGIPVTLVRAWGEGRRRGGEVWTKTVQQKRQCVDEALQNWIHNTYLGEIVAVALPGCAIEGLEMH